MKDESRSTQANPQAELLAARKYTSCPLCSKKKLPVCVCKGASVSGDDAEDDATLSKLETDDENSHPNEPLTANTAVTHQESKRLTSQLKLTNRISFNPKVIAELLAKLLIENNRENGILTLKWHPLLSADQREELRKILAILVREFEDFRIANRITDKRAKIEINDFLSFLRLTLPNATLYDAFIQQLNNKNLLPFQINKPSVNAFNPTALPTTLKLSANNKRRLDEDEDTHHARRYGPLSTRRGPRPKGF